MKPRGRLKEAFGQETDIKTKLASPGVSIFLGGRQEIEQERRKSTLLEHAGYVAISRAVTAAARSVRKQHDTGGSLRYHQIPR
jgi:hypothetical protein